MLHKYKNIMKTLKIDKFKLIAIAAFVIGGYLLTNAFGPSTILESSNNMQSPIVFEYVPPAVDHPYDEMHVKNTANWQPLTGTPCDPFELQEIPCSITVPYVNTTDGGTKINSNVEITTFETDEQIYGVDESSTSEYTNPINKEL